MRASSFLLLGSVLALTSCEWPFGYNWMPDGYRYKDDTPLSSPAPSSPWYSDADYPNLDLMADNTAAWQGAIYELINPLPSMVMAESQTLSLSTRQPSYPADNAFDHYLRQALTSYGYRVVSEGDVRLVYDSSPLNRPDIRKLAEQKFGPGFVQKGNMNDLYYLTLQVIGKDGKLITDRATIAVLPHEKDEYRRVPGITTQPTQGWRLEKKPVYNTRD